MTSLFQEYEQRRLIKCDPTNLIGKCFYWYKTRYGKQIQPFNDYNLFRVTRTTVIGLSEPIEVRYIYLNREDNYEYCKSLDYLLGHSLPYISEEVQ